MGVSGWSCAIHRECHVGRGMHWLHESWCVGRWHLINPYSAKLGFSEVSAGVYRNHRILSFPLSEKDHRTLVYKLFSELLFLMRWNQDISQTQCLWQCSPKKPPHLWHSVWDQRHYPTIFLMWDKFLSRDTSLPPPYQISDVKINPCLGGKCCSGAWTQAAGSG